MSGVALQHLVVTQISMFEHLSANTLGWPFKRAPASTPLSLTKTNATSLPDIDHVYYIDNAASMSIRRKLLLLLESRTRGCFLSGVVTDTNFCSKSKKCRQKKSSCCSALITITAAWTTCNQRQQIFKPCSLKSIQRSSKNRC